MGQTSNSKFEPYFKRAWNGPGGIPAKTGSIKSPARWLGRVFAVFRVYLTRRTGEACRNRKQKTLPLVEAFLLKRLLSESKTLSFLHFPSLPHIKISFFYLRISWLQFDLQRWGRRSRRYLSPLSSLRRSPMTRLKSLTKISSSSNRIERMLAFSKSSTPNQ